MFILPNLSKDPRNNKQIRYHILPITFGKNIKNAVHLAYVDKQVSAHTFRHSYATHLLQNNIDSHYFLIIGA